MRHADGDWMRSAAATEVATAVDEDAAASADVDVPGDAAAKRMQTQQMALNYQQRGLHRNSHAILASL